MSEGSSAPGARRPRAAHEVGLAGTRAADAIRGAGIGLRREHHQAVLDERPRVAWFEVILENISTYLEFRSSTLSECEFVAAVAEEADCDLLLDVNNVYVNARNHGLDPVRYIRSLPVGRVKQIHLAGHEDHGHVVLDTHD